MSLISARHPSSRFTIGAIAVALLSVGITVPASAAVTCNTTTPALDQVVTCTGSGNIDVTVPVGANAVSVVVSGAGGGAGYGSGGAGGTGAKVQAEFLISSVSTTRVVVGVLGTGGGLTNAGLGGGYSAVYRGASSAASDVLVVAGAGGGGEGVATGTGGIGGNGAAVGTAAGGDGASSGASAVFAGGAVGSGVGGIAGTYVCSGSGNAGQAWTAGGAGGAGYSLTNGGSGGAGYGGGGGGSALGSGGAGGSFADTTYLNGAAIYSAAGGAGGTSGNDGGAGSVVLTFRSSAGSGFSPAPSSEPETRHIVWEGAGADAALTDAAMNTWVKVPTNAVSGREGDRLLGWSTMADFPVDIALRQINNGWGAYEIFNENGSIRGVFIPVGNYVLINADDTLHAIWSSGQLMPKC